MISNKCLFVVASLSVSLCLVTCSVHNPREYYQNILDFDDIEETVQDLQNEYKSEDTQIDALNRIEWNLFKVKHQKSYSSIEEEKRRAHIFYENMQKVKAHNQLYELGLVTYSQALNHFADMTDEEFQQIMTPLLHNITELEYDEEDEGSLYIPPENVQIESQVDWRIKGAVTNVKNQGSCGSCWTFAATGALEGQQFRKTKRLVSLSEQNILDCSRENGNDGCNGGFFRVAFNYIKHNNGLDTEASYPYEGVQKRCRFNRRNVGATVKGFKNIKRRSERDLQSALSSEGPVAVTIYAGCPGFRFYHNGVFYNPYCKYAYLNHAVTAVGYGRDAIGGDYWLLKNSWGVNWGDAGYVRTARNKNNYIGIASVASFPLV